MTTKKKKPSHHPKKQKSEKPKPMPSLIFNEGTLNEAEQRPEEADTHQLDEIMPNEAGAITQDPYNPRAQNLMWLGVICMTLVIFGLWAWSIAFRFSTVKWAKTPENDFYRTTKANWESSFRTEDTAELSERIKSNLTKIVAGLSATSSVATVSTTSSTRP